MKLSRIIPLGLVGLMAAVGIFAYLQYRFSPEYREMKEADRIIEEIKREYAEDPYGGDTPEETLRLLK